MRRKGFFTVGVLAAVLTAVGCNNVVPEGLEARIRERKEAEKERERLLTEVAVVTTDKGSFTIRFHGEELPKSVTHIRKLIDDRFYDGLRFHRILKKPVPFLVQFGDPITRGKPGEDYVWDPDNSGKPIAGYNGGPEFTDLEESSHKHLRGTVAMARPPSRKTAGAQLFVLLSDQHHLDGDYPVIGEVIAGMDVLEKLEQGDRIQKVELVVPQVE